MKNYAFALFRYFPHGGLQRDMMRIAEELISRGETVTIYCRDWDAPSPKPGISVVKLPAPGWSNHRRAENFCRNLAVALRRDHHDLFVAFNRIPGADLYFAADNPFAPAAQRHLGFWSRLLPRYRTFARLERELFSPESKTLIMTLTRRQQEEFIAFYHTPESRFHLLPPGIAEEFHRPADPEGIRDDKRDELGVDDDDYLLLLVGSGFRTKGVDRAIAAVAALPSETLSCVRLFIAGRGNRERARKLARRLGVSDHVFALGGRDDVRNLMLAADLLIHPARNEAAGNVLIEALATGLPALVSGNCGFADIIAEAGGVVLDEPFRQRNLNMALQLTLTTPGRLDELKREAVAAGATGDFHRRAAVAADLIERVATEKVRS